MSQSLRFLKRALHFLAIAVLLSGIVSNAFAGGRKENALSKADRLISERRYNDAILALTTFMKEEPLRFDDAQKRLQKIVRLRDEYNTIAGELLDVLVNDPTNDERKLAMIKRLEELEAAPNRSAKEFLSRTKETALFTYNRAQFEKIMADGRALIDRNEFTAAARRYTDGFVLYRDEFYAEGYGDLVVSRVDGGIRTINSDIERFSNLLTRLSAAIAALEAALAQAQTMNDYASSLDAFQRAESLFLEFASIRNSVASSGRSLENQFLLLQGANKNIVESSFLPFAYRFVLGRKTEPRPEGILGSMDTLWINSANKVETASIAATDRLYASALNNTSGGEATALALDTSAAFADLSQRSLGLWAAIAGSEAVPALTSYGRTIVSGKVPLFLKYRTLFRAATYHAQAQREGKMLADLDVDSALNTQNLDSGLVSRQVSLSTENRLRATFKEVQTRVERQVQDLDAYAISVEEYQAKDLISPESSVFLADARRALLQVITRALANEIGAAARSYAIAQSELKESLAERRGEIEKGDQVMLGQTGASIKNPTESVRIFTALEKDLQNDLSKSSLLSSQIQAESEYIRQDERLVNLLKETQSDANRASAMLLETRSLLAQAQDRVRQAQSARFEADRRYDEARSALDRLNFDVARERVQRSGERYDFSLSIQDDPALRAERDQKLLTLSAEISKTENEVVVRDVRRLITEAKTSYFAGNFDRSEEALLQAQNRWKTTNVEDESEVAYWLTLVRSALAIKTGRTISPTAPLYSEMSQLLSTARRYFEEGRTLLNQGRKTDALSRFDLAKQKIQDVRIVFPINQEAALLALRIDQLIDPDAFNAAFRKRISDAQANLKTKPQESYSELQDLAEINPRFPGLRAIIEKAEIDIGLRLPPPDLKALARSEELYRAAKRIVDANLRGQFPVALEQLNEAVKLNPNNNAALALKDRIQTDVGGQSIAVLSSASERDYQRAVQELQNGNTIVALAIVQQLLQDSQNRNSPRILELQRRIQARL